VGILGAKFGNLKKEKKDRNPNFFVQIVRVAELVLGLLRRYGKRIYNLSKYGQIFELCFPEYVPNHRFIVKFTVFIVYLLRN